MVDIELFQLVKIYLKILLYKHAKTNYLLYSVINWEVWDEFPLISNYSLESLCVNVQIRIIYYVELYLKAERNKKGYLSLVVGLLNTWIFPSSIFMRDGIQTQNIP